jgi:hypothetical protein
MSAVLRTPTPPSYAYLGCRERGIDTEARRRTLTFHH